MTAQLSHAIFRPLAALAVALAFAFGLSLADGAAKPAAADASQWKVSQPHWWDQSNGWRRDDQRRRHWNGNQWHHKRHFNNGYGCFGNCGRPVIVFNGGGVVVVSPGFAVNQGHFIVNQGHFIVGQPIFVKRRPNFIHQRPAFVAKQKAFIQRHPSLQVGRPWKLQSWKHKLMPMRQGGVRMVTPGMN